MTDDGHSRHADRWPNAGRYVFFGFVAIAAFFLFTEHRAHLFGILPFLLLAACPLMHLFHHGGHGSHGGEPEGTSGASKDRDSNPSPPSDRSHQH